MLHQSRGLPVLRMIAFQAFHEGDNHRAIEVCVLAVTFFSSTPARIAAQISVGRSDHEPALVIFRTLKDVTSFVTFDLPGLREEICIPGFAKSDSLLKSCRRNGQRSAPLSWSTLS